MLANPDAPQVTSTWEVLGEQIETRRNGLVSHATWMHDVKAEKPQFALLLMPVPELNSAIYARRGFNVIATANNRDKGVNELSSALKRRFNVVVLPLPDDMDEEVSIVSRRVGEMAASLDLPVPKNVGEEIARVLTIFRELRSGATADGKVTLKTLQLVVDRGGNRNDGRWPQSGGMVRRRQVVGDGLAANLVGAIVKDPVRDKAVLRNISKRC